MFKLDKNPFNELTHVENIIWYDGPILSHLKDEKTGKNYFSYFVDSLDDRNIFLFFEVTKTDIKNYLYGKKSLRELIFSKEDWYLIHVLNITESEAYLCENVSEIDEDYLPGKESYYLFPIPNFYKTFFK